MSDPKELVRFMRAFHHPPITDPEVAALDAVRRALAPFDKKTRARIIRWAYSKYKVTP